MQYSPDMLGPGFEHTKWVMGSDQYSPRSATLIRYNPNQDPHAALPDRVIPANLAPGGGVDTRSLVMLPPQASPQQEAEIETLRSYHGVDVRTAQASPVAPLLDTAQQKDPDVVLEYLHAELRGRSVELAERWEDPPTKPKFVLIYLHGWNDYFYQTHLARIFAHLGARFYALELHRYGRNMPQFPPGLPWNCYVDDYREYDSQLEWALRSVRAENPGLPVVLMGHSNGGNIISGWAGRNHDKVDALIFNSPWIAQDPAVLPAGRLIEAGLRRWARNRHVSLPVGIASAYQDSLSGYGYLGSPLPKRLIPFQNDPSVKGWAQIRRFRLIEGAPVVAGWLSAVLRNHDFLKRHSDFGRLPVLCLTGNHVPDPFYGPEIAQVDRILTRQLEAQGRTASQRHRLYKDYQDRMNRAQKAGTWLPHPEGTPYYTELIGWSEAARHRDTVLNGELIEARARKIYPRSAVVKQLSGLHDLSLSQPLERVEFFTQIAQWVHAQDF